MRTTYRSFTVAVPVACFAALSLAAGLPAAVAQMYSMPSTYSAPYSSATQSYLDPSCGVTTQTVLEPQQVTAYRLQYETVMEERVVTTARPVMETEQRERRYRVARPVTETQTREERYRVMRPVTETETRYQQYTVRRPVTETTFQDRNYVTYRPVTTMGTQYVDQGGYQDQTVLIPGRVRNRLRWLPGTYGVNPLTGTTVFQRGGLHWVPTQGPGQYTVQRQYVPNVVACQVPQTTYQQEVVTEKVPVTVTRYQDEVVSQPVQVQVCKWVAEEVVKPVTFTTQRIEYEERTEPVQVQVCRMVNETKTIQVPRTVAKWVPYTTTRMVPRTVTMRVAPPDPCGSAVGTTSYYYPGSAAYSQVGDAASAAGGVTTVNKEPTPEQPTPASPSDETEETGGTDGTDGADANPETATVPSPTAETQESGDDASA